MRGLVDILHQTWTHARSGDIEGSPASLKSSLTVASNSCKYCTSRAQEADLRHSSILRVTMLRDNTLRRGGTSKTDETDGTDETHKSHWPHRPYSPFRRIGANGRSRSPRLRKDGGVTRGPALTTTKPMRSVGGEEWARVPVSFAERVRGKLLAEARESCETNRRGHGSR